MFHSLEKGTEAEAKSREAVKEVQTPGKGKRFYKKWWFWVLFSILIVIGAAVAILIIAGDGAPYDLIDLPEAEYRRQCKSYSYDEFARYPDAHEKKLVKLKGEVIQVVHNGNKLKMRVNVTRNKEGGYYEDTVFVFYTREDGMNILEGDIVRMYGELRGLQEYETVFGSFVTIPRVYVKFIDVVG